MNSNTLWNIFLAVGTALGIIGAFITDPADFGLSPIHLNWIRLIAVVLAGVGGAFGHKINVGRLIGGSNATNSNPTTPTPGV
jgi:hypothetical protein